MDKIIRIDLWDTHEDIETYFGKILTDYRRMCTSPLIDWRKN